MSWWVYVLECRDGTLYTGCTDDIPRRLEAHNAGRGAKYTRGRGPVTLRYREETLDKPAALRREAAIKRLSRTGKQALIDVYNKENKDEEKSSFMLTCAVYVSFITCIMRKLIF